MFAPAVDRLRADAVLLRHLRHGLLIGLAQDGDHLLFGESRFLHGPSFLRGRHSLKLQVVRKSPGRSAPSLVSPDIAPESSTPRFSSLRTPRGSSCSAAIRPCRTPARRNELADSQAPR